MAIYTHVLNELEEVSASEAVELLCQEFGLGHSCICFVNTQSRREVQTFLGASYMEGVAASAVGPIEFIGGPPDNRGLHTGSLLTYLCDVILYDWAILGAYTDLVEGDMKQINFSMLRKRFGQISTLDALELLCWTFGADKAYIGFGGQRLQLVDLYDDTSLFNDLAGDVPVQFYGGPPAPKWWDGTLLTMLIDHFLYAYVKNDLPKVHKALKAYP